MDNIPQPVNPSQQPTYAPPSSYPAATITQKPRSPLPMLLIGLVAGIGLAVAGYFGYNYWRLSQFVKVDNNNERVTQTVAEPTPSPDPTADWAIYTNTSSNYSIKYPATWKISNVAAGAAYTSSVPKNALNIELYKELDKNNNFNGTLGIEELGMIPPSEKKLIDREMIINGIRFEYRSTPVVKTKNWYWAKVPNQDKYVSIYLFKGDNEIINHQLDQILSTFKFTQENTNSLQTYTNSMFKFSFAYSSPFTEIKTNNDEFNRFVNLKSTDLELEVMLRQIPPNLSLDSYFYMDQTPSSKTTISGQPADVFIKSDNSCYGHGTDCPPYVAVVTTYKGDFWHIIFPNTTQLSSKNQQLLNTFEFTD